MKLLKCTFWSYYFMQLSYFSWHQILAILCLILRTTVTSLSAHRDTRGKTHALCVDPGVPFWTRETTHKLRTRWQASSSGIRADITVVLKVKQSIATTLDNKWEMRRRNKVNIAPYLTNLSVWEYPSHTIYCMQSISGPSQQPVGNKYFNIKLVRGQSLSTLAGSICQW